MNCLSFKIRANTRGPLSSLWPVDRGKPPSAKQRVRLAVLAALEKKPTDFADFLRLMEESGFAVKQGRGGVISFLAPGQEKPTRLRASTLGAGFDPEDIKAVIAGERPLPRTARGATVPATAS